MKSTHKKGGIIKWLIIIVVLVILASYFFNFDVQEAVEDEQTQANLGYIWNQVFLFWDNYLNEPVSYLWHDVFIDMLWEGLMDHMTELSSPSPSEFLHTAREFTVE